MPRLERISIRGFKSIENLENFEIRPLNILIGANGSGKSNFLSFFSLLRAMGGFSLPGLPVSGLANYVAVFGGSDTLLFNGAGQTRSLSVTLETEGQTHEFVLVPAAGQGLCLASGHEDTAAPDGTRPSGHAPRHLAGEKEFCDRKSPLHRAIASWMPCHFHETGAGAALRRSAHVFDVASLRPDGSNLAPVLLHLRTQAPRRFHRLVETVRRMAPYFEDFCFLTPFEDQVSLAWKQRHSDYLLRAYQLSDGTLRFLALATALLQPEPPSLMLMDEPELGLHPQALALLADLIKQAASRSQIVLATQSAALLDFFSLEDVVIVTRQRGASVFFRPGADEDAVRLKDCSPGELWRKNVLAAGPVAEQAISPS